MFSASAFLAGLGPGCSQDGTGTVEVKGPEAIREKLDKGSKPVAASKSRDDGGIKFRKKGD